MISKGFYEVLSQGIDVWILFLKLINRHGIRYCFNKTASWTRCNNIEWFEPNVQVMCLEDVLKFLNQLRRKLLLRQVIGTLHNHRYDTIVRHLSIDTLLLRLATNLSVCLGSK